LIAASGGSGFFLIIILAFALLWLIVVRPQRKRQNQQQQMLNELNVGDEVLTAGGIYGTISEVDDDHVIVEIAPNTEVRVARRAIAGVTTEPEPEEPEESDEADDGDETDEADEPESSAEPDADPNGVIPSAEASNEENRG
jgi:preprotein translocase subunit YajC